MPRGVDPEAAQAFEERERSRAKLRASIAAKPRDPWRVVPDEDGAGHELPRCGHRRPLRG